MAWHLLTSASWGQTCMLEKETMVGGPGNRGRSSLGHRPDEPGVTATEVAALGGGDFWPSPGCPENPKGSEALWSCTQFGCFVL